MRACGRHLLGLLGHVRPAAHERLRRSRHVDHLRAHGYRRRVLPVPYRGAQLARSRSGVPRLALARADRGVRHFRRAVDPAQLLERHLVHECRRGHYHRAGGARAHHAVRVRSRQAPAACSRGGRPRVRAGRHADHRHARRDRPAGHPCRGIGLGPRVGRGFDVLHPHARARAEEVGLHAGDGPCHAVRRIGRLGGGAAVDHAGEPAARRHRGAGCHRDRGHLGSLHAVSAGRERRRPRQGEPSVLRRARFGRWSSRSRGSIRR